jgi:hypothetical protein
MNIGMIRINRPPFLAEDALLYFLEHRTERQIQEVSAWAEM